MKKRFEIKNWISVIVLAALFVVLGTMSGGKLITPLNIKNLLEQSLPIIIGGAGVIYIIAKYSLQGTTQGNGLTGGVPPVRFSM